MPQTPNVPETKKKKERPFLGKAIVNGNIRYTSAKQILTFDDQHSGCPRKFANMYVFGKKVPRMEHLDEGVSMAEIAEMYLTTGEMVLTPMMQKAIKFFPDPRNEFGILDLVCEQPLGDIAAAVDLRDKILARPNAKNLEAANEELRKRAGLAALGIPFEGAADWWHTRQTYKDKDGVVRKEKTGDFVIGLGDLKSISQINTHITVSTVRKGWAQTDAEVVTDPQMVAYSKALIDKHTMSTHVRDDKVYVQKKPFGADIRGGLCTRQQVEDRWGDLVERVVSEMVDTAKADRIEDVRPATGSCDSFTHLIPCGFPGCGRGCFPGKIRNKEGVESPCPHCKGKAKIEKGCYFRGKPDCPLTPGTQVSLINITFDRTRIQGEPVMSLFDSPADAPVAPPTPPAPPMDDATYAAMVAAAEAAIEDELLGDDDTDVPSPPSPPSLPEVSAPLPPAPPAPPSPPKEEHHMQGEQISVMLCAAGEEYLVDCEDGAPPRQMAFRGCLGGVFKFVGPAGDKVDCKTDDKVFRLPVGTPLVMLQPTMSPSDVKPPDAPKTPWADQQQPLSDEAIAEITNPALRELAVAHKALIEGQAAAEAAADPDKKTRGGNCPYSGTVTLFSSQPSVVDGKLVCPTCGMEKPIPREIRKAVPKHTEMPFPGHRRPKEEGKVVAPVAPAPPVAPTVTVAPPKPPVPPTTHVTPPTPPVASVGTIEEVVTAAEATGSAVSIQEIFPEGTVYVTREEIDVLSALFRDRAAAIPKAALAHSTISLLQRLKLVD